MRDVYEVLTSYCNKGSKLHLCNSPGLIEARKISGPSLVFSYSFSPDFLLRTTCRSEENCCSIEGVSTVCGNLQYVDYHIIALSLSPNKTVSLLIQIGRALRLQFGIIVALRPNTRDAKKKSKAGIGLRLCQSSKDPTLRIYTYR